ncbi:MAG: hypothetical protein ACE3L7_02905 [Candidatus Pristimantibacillus sp.]
MLNQLPESIYWGNGSVAVQELQEQWEKVKRNNGNVPAMEERE